VTSELFHTEGGGSGMISVGMIQYTVERKREGRSSSKIGETFFHNTVSDGVVSVGKPVPKPPNCNVLLSSLPRG